MWKTVALGLLCLMGAGWTAAQAAAEELVLYNFRNRMPYHVIGLEDPAIPGRCVFVDLAVYLNARQDQYRVRIEFLPHARLQRRLGAGQLQGGVVSATPAWFHDLLQERYLWTPPFLSDANVWVTLPGRTFDIGESAGWAGKTVALQRGFFYPSLLSVAEEEGARVEFSETELQNLKKVARHRADATLVTAFGLKPLLRAHGLADQLETLEGSEDPFEWRILLPIGYEGARDVLEPILRNIPQDPEWAAMLRVYDLPVGGSP